MLGWFWKLHRWVVGSESWAAAYSWLSEHIPKVWDWTKERWATLVAMISSLGVGTWFASGINAVNALGWGAWPFVGLGFALGLAVLFHITASTVGRLKQSTASAQLPALDVSSSPAAVPSTTPSRLPTAAELLDEQERREAFHVMEGLFQHINSARSQLETVIIGIATIAANDGSPQLKALQYFVDRTVYSQYRPECKAAVRKADDAISHTKSLDELCSGVVALIRAYSLGQTHLGILVAATGIDISRAPHYEQWHTSEREYVTLARQAATYRVLSKVLYPNCSSVQVFEERDPQSMTV